MGPGFAVSPALLVPLALFAALGVGLVLLGKVPVAYNVRNLVVRWRITLLTALAFTLVVGINTVMLAFVNGMNKLTEGSGQPGNVIVLADGATDELFSDLGYGDVTRLEQIDGVERRDGKPLVSWETYIVATQPLGHAKANGAARRLVQVRGVVDPVVSGAVHNLPLHDGGEWFSAAGVGADGKGGKAIQAVVGEGIARELGKDAGKPSLELGDGFRLGDRDWVVTGVMRSAGSTFDSEVWAKSDVAGDVFNKKTRTTAVLGTPDAAAAKQMAEFLTREFKSPAVQAQTEPEYYSKLNATNLQFLVAIEFVAVIMAIGGVFGVMNTMFAAVSQRTKDIGVLRILGFARWQVLTSFFLEALLLAAVGGVLGCAVGYLADGRSATSILSSGQGGGKTVVLNLIVDANTLVLGLLFSLGMGCIGGLVPALSAMRLRPLESLR